LTEFKKQFFFIIFLLFLLPLAGHSVLLKRTGQFISLAEDAEVQGLSSGRLIITDSDKLTCYNIRLKETISHDFAPGEKPVSSTNGGFWGIVRKSELNGFGEEINSVEIFDFRNRRQWSVDGIVEGDTYLSPAGDYLAVIKGIRGRANTELFIYHRDSVGIRFYINDCNEFVFSEDGRRFFINSAADGLKMYDYTGRLLSNYGFQQNCAFSENSELSACFSQGKLLVINDTAIVSEVEIGEMQMRTMLVSDSIDRVFCIAGHRLIVVDITNNSIDWDYRLETATENFLNIDISGDSRFVVLGLNVNRGMSIPKEERYREGYLYFFNVGGDIMLTEGFSFRKYAPGTPRVAFWPDGRSIMVQTFGRIDVVEMR